MGIAQTVPAPEMPTLLGEPASRDRDADALREENKQLRELVIQLSKIVLRHVAENH
jgi:hypothetical protein